MVDRIALRCLLAGLLCACSAFATAHTQSVAHLRLTQGSDPTMVAVSLDLALPDLELAVGLDGNGDGDITWGELESRRDAVQDFAARGISLVAQGTPCALTNGRLGLRDYADGAYAHLPFTAACRSADIELRYDLLFDEDSQHRARVVIDRPGVQSTVVLEADHAPLQLAAPSGAFVTYLREGVHHILIGYDHLAFLASLLLAIALVRRDGRWQREGSLRRSVARAAGLVTAFTLAHSLTLTLAALGWVTPASKPVEILIAASVIAAALNNVWPLATRRLWAVALVFGLIHGFGFAGALGELGLPTGARLTALFAFNLGVELGQLGVALVALPLIHAASRWRHYPRAVLLPLSIAIAALGLWWLLQRLTG